MKRGFALLNIFLVLLVLASCASNPYSKTNRIYKKQAKVYAKQLKKFPLPEKSDGSALYYGEYRVGTTNFNLRKPNYVVIHHTAQDSVEQTLKTFTLSRTQVSSHYVIGRDGDVYHMLNDYFRGWHGGVGKWGNNSDLNSSSIGIELDNNGFEEFSLIQIHNLLKVLENLKVDYKIPAENFIGHSDIAPGRKVDPNVNFPWKRLAEEGYGLWYDEEEVENLKTEAEFFKPNPLAITSNSKLIQRIPFMDKILLTAVITATFDVESAFRIIGLDTSNMAKALQSFQLLFIQEEINCPITKADLTKLYNLYQKSL